MEKLSMDELNEIVGEIRNNIASSTQETGDSAIETVFEEGCKEGITTALIAFKLGLYALTNWDEMEHLFPADLLEEFTTDITGIID